MELPPSPVLVWRVVDADTEPVWRVVELPAPPVLVCWRVVDLLLDVPVESVVVRLEDDLPIVEPVESGESVGSVVIIVE